MTSTGAAGSNPTHVDTDFPMFRLADAYLIYAEAVLRGGGGDRGAGADLRERAPDSAPTGTRAATSPTPELTLDFILDERGRELLWEGHRRTDLVRYRPVHRRRIRLGLEGRRAGGHRDRKHSGISIRCRRPSWSPTRT